MKNRIKVALAGNPNSGKSTIFNHLAGAHQHVANYPGVTVEVTEGIAVHDGVRFDIVDLPGTYSLTAYTPEERIARDYMLKRKPDVVVAVVDASNLERNLYLVVQLVELGMPVVVALNMMDVAERRGLTIDHKRLSELTGVTFVPTVGHRAQGVEDLKHEIMKLAESGPLVSPESIGYGRDVNAEMSKVEALLSEHVDAWEDYSVRWLAVSLLEEDSEVIGLVESKAPNAEEILAQAARGVERIRSLAGAAAETVIADRRYGFISGACQESVISDVETRHIFSDKIDIIATHGVLGLPILLALMYAVFYLTFNLASHPSAWIDQGRVWLSEVTTAAWHVDPYQPLNLRSLVVDGILGGVGGVIVFLPPIMVLFMAIAALEDSGYMARAAFVTDHLMHKIGLHGKSFIPMILGFGCSVPAIMATRIIENRRDRLTTMFIVPLMSCSGRYPAYTLLIAAFFPLAWRGPMLWFIYILGAALAVAAARLLKSTVLRGEAHPLVMELPPYRMPTLKGLLIHTWERSWMFLRKAGTVILAAAIILWFFTNWPAPPRAQLEAAGGPENVRAAILESSVVGRVGKAMEPGLELAGFDWKVGTALIGATAAKEIFVAQMGIIYGLGEGPQGSDTLAAHLSRDYSGLAGFGLLVFTLMATPCIATVAIMRRESGSWTWPAFQWLSLTGAGYLFAVLIFQLGSLISSLTAGG